MKYDYIIIGGGIIGLATAWQLKLQHPGKHILLLEKEHQFATHQTGHNSGVIHAGVYYEPGSLKAQFCKQGLKATIAFCRQHAIDFKQCGKLLVATNQIELQRMQALLARCRQNGIDAELLNACELKQLEPHIVGVGAIRVKDSSIVDYQQVCIKIAECFCQLAGQTRLNTRVTALSETDRSIVVSTKQGCFETAFLINCSGLMADRIVAMLGIETDFQIIPYRGEYYQLRAELNTLVNHLIYPIPDPALPFLGVHLTRMVDGSITVGPNAVQGFKREGYGKWNFNVRDVWDMCRFPGFWKVVLAHRAAAFDELRSSLCKRYYLKRVQKYCPEIQLADLQPYPAGVRAQAVMRDGRLMHDFLFVRSNRSLHVCNAPSPAATSAIPIANYICSQLE